MKKQKIEAIFSSIEDFSSVPPPELWDAIEKKLNKPKKKKRVILWWSAAACLLACLTIPSVLNFNTNEKLLTPTPNSLPKTSIVIQESSKNPTEKRMLPENIAAEKTNAATSSPEKNKLIKSVKKTPVLKQNTSAIVALDFDKKSKIKTSSHQKESTKEPQSKTIDTLPVVVSNEAVVLNTKNLSSKNLSSKLNENNQQLSSLTQKTIVFDSQKQDSEKSFSAQEISTEMVSSDKETKLLSSKTDLSTTLSSGKLVVENSKKNLPLTPLLTAKDSVQLTELQRLEKTVVEGKTNEEEKKKTTSNSEKWSLAVFAGIANSENYSNQKTLGNTNESKQTKSYGVKTNYKLNKKWAISSGLKINELGQSIANVTYFTQQNTASLTIDYLVESTYTAPKIGNNPNYVFVSNSTENSLKNSNFESGNIDQSLKYIEMPLEVSYALFCKNKTSLSLNTGGFVGKLISNEISLNGNSIGDNLNANSFVYGSLLSSTFQYRLYKKTKVFVEPGMNYYFNPLNNQTFNQFQWAFNFGLNVSF